jgi:hypothetical protein
MKTLFKTTAMTASLAFAGAAAAQEYAIDWFTVDSGGGTSTGGRYSLSGTAGQADASLQPMTGGSFSLVGGYWSLFAVQPPDGVLLTFQPVGSGRTTLSWFPDAPGFRLQETMTLSPAGWINSPSGSTNPVIIPLDVVRRFYRVFKPKG